jgi:hypothetical protein
VQLYINCPLRGRLAKEWIALCDFKLQHAGSLSHPKWKGKLLQRMEYDKQAKALKKKVKSPTNCAPLFSDTILTAPQVAAS